jgi:hypothetical protein
MKRGMTKQISTTLCAAALALASGTAMAQNYQNQYQPYQQPVQPYYQPAPIAPAPYSPYATGYPTGTAPVSPYAVTPGSPNPVGVSPYTRR